MSVAVDFLTYFSSDQKIWISKNNKWYYWFAKFEIILNIILFSRFLKVILLVINTFKTGMGNAFTLL